MDYFFFNYRADKMVRMKSPRLRVPHLLLQVAVIGYIVVYQLCYKMLVFKCESIESQAQVELRPPVRNFWDCYDIDFNCNQLLRPLEELHYCNESSLPSDVGCSYFDVRDMMPYVHARANLAATMVTTIPQEKSHFSPTDNDFERVWSNLEASRQYVADVEDYLIRIKHSFHSDAYERTLSQSDTQAFLKFQTDPDRPRNIACHSADCSYTKSDWNNTDWYPFCAKQEDQYSQPANGDTCLSSDSGDYISLKILLDAANISLDDIIWGNAKISEVMGTGASKDMKQQTMNVTRRFAGVALELDILYTNDDPFEYWDWQYGEFFRASRWHRPKGCFLYYPSPRVKYTYSVTPVHFSTHDRIEIARIAQEDSKKRTVVRLNGVLLLIRAHGRLGDLSFLHTLLTVAIAASLFRICSWIVDHVLVKLYKLCPCSEDFRRASILHSIVWEDYATEKVGEPNDSMEWLQNLEQCRQKHAEDIKHDHDLSEGSYRHFRTLTLSCQEPPHEVQPMMTH